MQPAREIIADFAAELSTPAARPESAGDQTAPTEKWRFSTHGPARSEPDELAVEEPLEIRIRGRCIAVTMRTPGHDQELAAGFLWSEGILTNPSDILGLRHCTRGPEPERRNILNAFLAPAVSVDFEALDRHFFMGSSCGICGKASIEAIHRNFPPVSRGQLQVSRRLLLDLPTRLRLAQPAFARTGGLHAAAVFDAAGTLLAAREDVGRHNAVDKVLGLAVLDRRLPLDNRILLVSGRASFEILQKALSARIPLVAAVSAPSSLAVDFARESGQTLAGFLRGQSLNVYSHPERVS